MAQQRLSWREPASKTLTDARPIVLYALIQFAALIALIELFVICMPQALRRASKQNCYRMDGTLSGNRAYRERRARNRLRRDMIAVMVLVFLTGNALYFTIDSKCNVGTLYSYLTTRPVSSNPDQVNKALGEEAKAAIGSRDASPSVAFERIKRDLPWIAGMSLIWLLGCCAVIAFGAMRAYRDFAAGVNARAAEHFHLDMTRMSVTDVDVAAQLLHPDSSHGAA